MIEYVKCIYKDVVSENVLNIHGHFHNAFDKPFKSGNFDSSWTKRTHLTNNHILLAIEYTNYKLVELTDIIYAYRRFRKGIRESEAI